jgi:riboflavin synthase
MFTGIIETLGIVETIEIDGGNRTYGVRSSISSELKIDQSISHNGVCLTVIAVEDNLHKVTAIAETLEKSNLNGWQPGTKVNLERCTQIGARLDGHIVQGHVDQTGTCIGLENQDGSWVFTFQYDANAGNITVEKGSITVNGISLTVVNSKDDQFSVAIIPYTYEHTNLHEVKVGDTVNLEFDIVGKYVAKLFERRQHS